MADLSGKLEAARAQARAGRIEPARRLCHEILAVAPDHVDTLHLLGVLALRSDDPGAAIEPLTRALKARPGAASCHREIGTAHLELGALDAAARHLGEALRLDPDEPRAHHRLGQVRRREGRPEEAAARFEAALERDPEFLDALISLATLREARGERALAAALYRRALELDPDCYAALVNLGNILDLDDAPNEAAACYRKAIAARARPVEALVNFGNLLSKQGRLKAAVECYERALGLSGRNAIVHNNLANLLKNRGEIDPALEHYRIATELDPGFPVAASNRVFAMTYSARFDAPALYAAHRRWAERWADPLAAKAPAHTNDPAPDRRLRLGYLSPDFWTHSVACFLEPLLAHHDHAGFEIVAYADHKRADATTARLRRRVDRWREVRALTDDQIAGRVRADGIDILVDLAGHTAGNRMGVFARKPAPIQVAYLGYPATTGMAAIDYRLTDAYADPEGESDSWHSEALVRLPRGFHCFRPPDEAPEVAPLPARAAGYVTFGSFNNLGKVGPETVALWARVLVAVPGSRLLLKSPALADPGTRDDLAARFAAVGVARERLEMLGRIPSRARHLALYARIDLALDSFPYNGVTTSCEALWMGVPVVSLGGATHASRVGASLLAQLDLAEFAVRDGQAFVARACRLAGDLDRLGRLRAGLRARMRASPLLDGPGLARAIEAAYRAMWRRWCAGRTGAGAGS